MVFYYFPTKDDLFLAVVEEVYAKLLADLRQLLAADAPVRERLRALFRRIGAFTPEEAETFRLVLSEAIKSPERRTAVFGRAWRGHLPLVFAALEGGKRAGDLVKGVPTPLLGLVTAAVGVLPQIAARNLPMGLTAGEAMADRLVDILFDASATGTAGPAPAPAPRAARVVTAADVHRARRRRRHRRARGPAQRRARARDPAGGDRRSPSSRSANRSATTARA